MLNKTKLRTKPHRPSQGYCERLSKMPYWNTNTEKAIRVLVWGDLVPSDHSFSFWVDLINPAKICLEWIIKFTGLVCESTILPSLWKSKQHLPTSSLWAPLLFAKGPQMTSSSTAVSPRKSLVCWGAITWAFWLKHTQIRSEGSVTHSSTTLGFSSSLLIPHIIVLS